MVQTLKRIKKTIKQSKVVRLWKRSKLRENMVARKLNKDPRKFSNHMFKLHYHRNIDWENPVLFDEKCMVLKCTKYYKNDQIIQCSDKYRVREYVISCGLEHTLNDLLGVWDDASQINIEELPKQFALKCNNDCGGVLVVSDKDMETNLQARIKKLNSRLTRKYGVNTGEIHYQDIKPCIICEKYIGEKDGSFPNDYKFYCMNGKVRCVLVCKNRDDKDKFDTFMVDEQFKLLDIRKNQFVHTDEELEAEKPALFEEMIKTAEILAKPFPFVRVDLYNFENKVLFGELTFTPHGCIHDHISLEGQRLLGSWMEI